ncbi:hypothetical protein DTO212C5_1955 [Paecilomyces variotii]|nr:hypothetical protein DTO212C5_1955 [Paecilomyces variotii]
MSDDFNGALSKPLVESSTWKPQCQCSDRTMKYRRHGNDNWEEHTSSLCNAIRVVQSYSSAVVFGSSKEIKTCKELEGSSFFCKGFWPVILDDLNGSFNCKYEVDEEGDVIKHISWSCFKIKEVQKAGTLSEVCYDWSQVAVLVQFEPATGRQTVFFLDLPADRESQLRESIDSTFEGNPYIWHALFMEQAKELYDKAIWSVRHLVRDVEKGRNRKPPIVLDFPDLHDIARHISHVNEILQVAEHTAQRIVHEQATWITWREKTDVSQRDRMRWIQNQQDLLFFAKEIHCLKTRSRSLAERMQNEINLAFNLVSRDMGKSAQGDNAIMKTIALASFIYLPGTFVSGLFGSNFFNLDSSNGQTIWTVSNNFWLYWAITIPLTFGTVMIWIIWHYVPGVNNSVRRIWRRTTFNSNTDTPDMS